MSDNMEASSYRPWGAFSWILSKYPDLKWDFIGSLWTEERGLSAWQLLHNQHQLASTYFARVFEPPSRYTAIASEKMQALRAQYQAMGGLPGDVHDHELFDRAGSIENTIKLFIKQSGPNVILDISSLPKRYFFPFVKFLIREKRIENLIFTYTLPRAHTKKLAENYQDWNTLPMFQGTYPEPNTDMLVVSVGYLAMGLPEQLEHDNPHLSLKVLLPFPPGPPSFQKTLDLVRLIRKNLRADRLSLVRVSAVDMPDAYDHILAHTRNGELSANFAPFGPKPISLAMAIFASAFNRPVFYNQPRTYNPDYSIGVATAADGLPETYGYCIRLRGHDYYNV